MTHPDDFYSSMDATLERTSDPDHQEAPMPTDRNGHEVYAEQELDREEMADLLHTRGIEPPRHRHRVRGTVRDEQVPATWEPTEADVEAGREW